MVADYEAGGLSREEFCRQHGLALSTLERYRRRQRQAQGETAGAGRWLAVELSGPGPAGGSAAGSGLWVCAKRLEQGRFRWLEAAGGQPKVALSHAPLALLELEPGVSQAEVQAESEREPPPARIIDKSLVSDRVVIDTVVAKYSDHLPLYRQSAILARETGLELSRATLDGGVMRVGELLTPVAAVIGRELVGGTYIQADETPVDPLTGWPRAEPSGLSVAIQPTGRQPGVRLPPGARARRAQGVPGQIRGYPADRRLCRLRSGGRAEDGARRLLGAGQKEVLRGGKAQPRRCG